MILYSPFHFAKENKVEFQNSSYLTKNEYEHCLNGNAMNYYFNPKMKVLEVEKIYWETSENG